jgi:putative transposase
VHPNQIGLWKKKLLKDLPLVFQNKSQTADDFEEKESELYRQIGQLKVEIDWLKKNPRCLLQRKKITNRIKCRTYYKETVQTFRNFKFENK